MQSGAVRPVLLVLALASLSVAQTLPVTEQQKEIAEGPPLRGLATPETVMYRIFFTHVAVFEQNARNAEAHGKSGAPWRNHLLHKYGLTSAEQQQIATEALSYHNQMNAIRAQVQLEKAAFEQQYGLSDHKGHLAAGAPLHPSAIHSLRKQADALTLNSKAHVQTLLGDTRFGELDQKIHDLMYNTQ